MKGLGRWERFEVPQFCDCACSSHPKPPAHLQGKVSLADVHSRLAVVGIQVEQKVICGGLGGANVNWGGKRKAEGCDPGKVPWLTLVANEVQ